jgi:hypothetical protein
VEHFLIKAPELRPGADAALARMAEECLLHELKPSRERLKQFIIDPEKYPEYERKMLFGHYIARARTAAKNRQTALALKSLEQAKVFGLLSKEDERLITFSRIRNHVKKYVAIGLLVLLGVGFFFLLVRFGGFGRQKISPLNTASQESIDTLPVIKNTGSAPPAGVAPENVKIRDKVTRQDKLPEYGFVLIKTNPPWARIFIDNIERGVTPANSFFRLSPGRHALRIVKEGFEEYHKTILISKSDTLFERVQFLSAAEPSD